MKNGSELLSECAWAEAVRITEDDGMFVRKSNQMFVFLRAEERVSRYSLCTEVVGTRHQQLHAVDRDDAHDQKTDGSKLHTNTDRVCAACKGSD